MTERTAVVGAKVRRMIGAIGAGTRVLGNEIEGLLLAVAFVGGLAAIALGAAAIYRPAGAIVAGLLLAGSAIAYSAGRS